MTKTRTRFAPSPTGYMHIGNLRTALYEYLVAKKDGGDFILRIEDTDQQRYVDGAVDIIYDTLKMVGLNHDEGPDKPGDCGPYVQSERLPIYMEYAKKLVELGGAHYCFCDTDEIERQKEEANQEGKSYKFSDPCRFLTKQEVEEKLASGAPFTIRQTINPIGKTSFHDEVYGDIEVDNDTLDESVLIKSDGYPTYNFANVVDDHLMGITHVVRGNEYLSSTPKYNLIYQAYGWQIPTYIHCAPVMKDEQHKLSKRNGDASFQDLVKKGYLPEAILNYIALLGWSPETDQEIYTLEELTHAFSVERINRAPAIFDIEKLTWMNGMYLREMSVEAFNELAKPYYEGLNPEFDQMEISKILQPRVSILSEIPEMIDFFNAMPDYDIDLYVNKKMKTTLEIALKSLNLSKALISELNDWSQECIHDALMNLAKEQGMKNGQLLFPLRLALTGKKFTPGGAIEIAHILGKEKSIERINTGIEKLIAAGIQSA